MNKTATARENQELANLLAIEPMWKTKLANLEGSTLPKLEQDRIRKGGETIEARIKELQALGAKAPPG